MADVGARADVRVRVLHRYPYLIAYIIRDPQIVILAVAHQHRQPGYWLSRLPQEPGTPV
ncbi:MAG: type II toxin-antitoxin system RelE/ParE family toxin [Myxococcales bacterium]|nr:type II toxin-antitoxin system RelE/ParE family toxin [Myxococcales bacterium]